MQRPARRQRESYRFAPPPGQTPPKAFLKICKAAHSPGRSPQAQPRQTPHRRRPCMAAETAAAETGQKKCPCPCFLAAHAPHRSQSAQAPAPRPARPRRAARAVRATKVQERKGAKNALLPCPTAPCFLAAPCPHRSQGAQAPAPRPARPRRAARAVRATKVQERKGTKNALLPLPHCPLLPCCPMPPTAARAHRPQPRGLPSHGGRQGRTAKVQRCKGAKAMRRSRPTAASHTPAGAGQPPQPLSSPRPARHLAGSEATGPGQAAAPTPAPGIAHHRPHRLPGPPRRPWQRPAPPRTSPAQPPAGLWVAGCGLRVAGCGLRVAGCRFAKDGA